MDLKSSTPARKESSNVLKNVVNMEISRSETLPEQCKNFASMKIPVQKPSQKENNNLNKMSQRQYFNNTQLSPIADEVRQNHLINTVVHNGHETAVKDSKEPCWRETNNQTFLTPQYKESKRRSRYESVLATLVLLSAYQQTFEPVEPDPKSKQKVIKPGLIKSSTPKKFRFTTGMFKESNNSVAFIHASHLLLEMYDPEEAAVKFRDVWPQYEKRQEGLYRRVAHNWMKEIVIDNPHVFKAVVKPEQLQGLVVNPYGDRFIKFFATFSNFVMARVLAKDELFNRPVLSCPSGAPEPEVFFGQMSLLHNLTLKSQATIRKETNLLGKLKILVQKEMRCLRKEKTELERNSTESSDAAFSRWVQEYNQDIDIRVDIRNFVGHTINRTLIQNLYSQTSSISPSHLGLKNAKCRFVQSLQSKLTSNPLLDKKRLWILLRASQDKKKSIDGSMFSSHKAKKIGDIPIAIEVSASNLAEATKLLKPISISTRTLSSLDFSRESVSLLRQRAVTAPKLCSAAEFRALKQEVMFDIRRLSFELQNMSWASCSGVTIPSLASAFHLSPIKTLDSTEITGLTPKLSSYLPLTLGVRNSADISTIDASQFNPRFTGGYASTVDYNMDSSVEGYGLSDFGTPVTRQENKLRDSTNKLAGTSIFSRKSLETRLQLFIPNNSINEEIENGSPSRTPPPPSVKAMVSATLLSSIHHDQDTINQCRASLQVCRSFDTTHSAPGATSTVNVEPVNSDGNISCSELENTLGISDVTASYAKFLDLDCSIDNI